MTTVAICDEGFIPTWDGEDWQDYACHGCPGCNLGHLIANLGQRVEAGELTTAQAVPQLVEADPSLTEQGARLQLGAWRSAVSRYSRSTAVIPRPASPRDGLPPIVFKVNRQEVGA